MQDQESASLNMRWVWKYLLLLGLGWFFAATASFVWNTTHEQLDLRVFSHHEGTVLAIVHVIVWGLGVAILSVLYVGLKRYAQERSRSERLQGYLSAIVTSSRDAIISMSNAGDIVSWNHAAEQMFGYTEPEAIGAPFSLLVPDGAWPQIESLCARSDVERAGSYEMVFVAKDGSRLDVAITVSPLRETPGPASGFSVIARDVTERNLMLARLQQAQKMEAIGALASGIAHNFGNLLNTMMGHAQVMGLEQTENTSASKHVQRILMAGRHASDMISALLSFARESDANPESIDIHETIHDTLLLMTNGMGNTIRFTVHLNASRSLCMGNPSEVESIFMNLVGNASDAMPEGGEITFETRLVTFDEDYCRQHDQRLRPGEYLEIAVTDDGTGMDPETQARIFEPFFTTKAPGKGTGLGLATVYGTVQKMKGAIDVTSAIGQGTTFRVCLPACAPTP